MRPDQDIEVNCVSGRNGYLIMLKYIFDPHEIRMGSSVL